MESVVLDDGGRGCIGMVRGSELLPLPSVEQRLMVDSEEKEECDSGKREEE